MAVESLVDRIAHLWQFDTNSKDTNSDNHSCHFQCDFIRYLAVVIATSPASRIEQAQCERPEDDSYDSRNDSFTDIQSLLDEKGTETEQDDKSSEKGVGEMGSIDVEGMEWMPRAAAFCFARHSGYGGLLERVSKKSVRPFEDAKLKLP